MLFCGRITNCFEDYFAGEEDYAKHLASYVDFEQKKTRSNVELGTRTEVAALKAFCMDRRVNAGSPTGTIG